MKRLACVALVDERGWILLQERDDHAPRGANQWGLPGGHVEAEETFQEAAYRELSEETGIRLEPGHLWLWREEDFRHPDLDEPSRYNIYVGRVDGIGDADIVLGEGRQIVFVDPGGLGRLDLTASARHFATQFAASATYQRLAGLTPPGSEASGQK